MAVKYDPILDELRESDAGAGYTLPTASGVTLGGVRVGARLTMTGEVLSADVQTTDISGKVDKNIAITAGTKTKITYDAKGLITVGADATTADVADSTNKRYVTDANLTVIGNTSGTNTGDNATNSQYSGLATSKQDALSGTGFVKIAGTTISYDNSTYLTSLSGAVLTDQTVGQTIGLTGARLTKLWATDITVTNAITGSVTGNAGTVTTNANLTGVITSVGNATSIASQTGTGTKFVVDTSPTIITPTIANLIGNKIYPASDSTTAIQINKADNTTNVLNIDTTNGHVGIGTTAPTNELSIKATTASHGQILFGIANYSYANTRNDSTYLEPDQIFSVKQRYNNYGGPILSFSQSASNQNIAEFQAFANYNALSNDSSWYYFNSVNRDATPSSQAVASTGKLFTVANNDAHKFTILGNGNVGIGVTAPAGRLHINGTADDQQLIIEGHSTQTTNIVEVHNSSSAVLVSFDGVGGAIFNEQGSATADFRVESDTEADMIFLDANGNTDGTLYIGGNSLTTSNSSRKGGLFFPVQAPTASAPAYVKGAIYFDTTLNKLMVGGATAWEAITSV